MEQHKDLEIPLKEIAPNTFHNENRIGDGGFGKVYKGELSRFKERGLVAFKKLDRKYGQGETEFFKEIQMLSQYKHENIITLLGYCMEGKELILVYEYASNGSLESRLNSPHMTWTLRLKLCLQAAKGLRYLHDPNESRLPVIHRDIKSANILLDDKWNAKVSDFGLSKISPVNANLVTYATGTPGYSDPQYYKTYTLTEKSDIYSFGITLFEVLCGRLCYDIIGHNEMLVFVHEWMKSYEQNNIEEIIFKELDMKQIDSSSIKLFSDIAYKCLNESREERPTMAEVVSKLEAALQAQEDYEMILSIPVPKVYEEIVRAAVSRLSYGSVEELQELLSEGVLINGGKALFCLNEKGEHVERIFVEACLNHDEVGDVKQRDDCVDSRFPGGRCYLYNSEFKARVRGQYLTPQISYTVNLVFRYRWKNEVNAYNPLRYKIDVEEETRVFTIYLSTHMREDGWFIVPLYQFTSQNTTADLQFEFEDPFRYLLIVGIEFQPCEAKVELPVFEEYQHIVEAASQSLFYTSLDELKRILSQGVHINEHKAWVSLNKKGEHCVMISMKDCLIPNEDSTSQYESHCLSRFPAGFYDTKRKGFRTHVKTQLLNSLIPYTVNLVVNVDSSRRQEYVDLKYRINGETKTSTVYLAKKRDDYLYMAELYQVTSNGSLVDLEIDFEYPVIHIKGVEGILFQPLKKVEDQVLEEDKVKDIHPILDSDSDTYWGQKLANDYEEILKLSKHYVEGKTKKELYSMLRQGFLIDNGEKWLTVSLTGRICQMISARATCVKDDKNLSWDSSSESRFGEQMVITAGNKIKLASEIEPTLLSPDTTYASYIVYKLPEDQSTYDAPVFVWGKGGYLCGWYIYLASPPNTPIIGSKLDENNYNPLNRHKLNALPRERTDGWLEVRVWDFKTKKTPKTISMHIKLERPMNKGLCGLIIQGIEIRPT